MKSMVKKFFALSIAILMIVMSVAGCDKTKAPNESETLRIRKQTSLQSTDWQQVTTVNDRKIIWIQVFEGLYGMNEAKGGYYEELAENVDVSEDQRVYTIKIRDAKFANGDTLKASDVVFSYKRAMADPAYNYLTNMIDTVGEKDDRTVEFVLKYPYSAFAHTLFSIRVVSEREVTEAGETFGRGPHKAGTGPYYVSEYDPTAGVKLKANPYYWGGEPDFKDVEYVVIREDSAAVIAYENNEIDFMHDCPIAEWEALEKASNGRNAMIKSNKITPFFINWMSPVNNGILGNINVRRAILYAINNENIVVGAVNGYGFDAHCEFIPSEYCQTSPSYKDGGFEIYEYNPEKAKECLREAGFTDDDMAKGIDIGTILTSLTDTNPKVAVVIQGDLAKVGLKCEVKTADVAITEPQIHSLNYDMCVWGDSGNFDFNNIRQQVHSESLKSGMACVSYREENSPVDYERVEELCDLGVSTTDTQQRLAYYTELWHIIMDSATNYPCLNPSTGIVWSNKIKSVTPCPTYYHIFDFKKYSD